MDRPRLAAAIGAVPLTRGALYEKHLRLALAISREYFIPGSDRQDVEQEARIGLWIATGTWDKSKSPFYAWASLVVRRRLVTCVRMGQALKHKPLNDSEREVLTEGLFGEPVWIASTDLIEGGRDPLDVVIEREKLHRIGRAIAKLTPRQRECLETVMNAEEWQPGIPKAVHNAAYSARAKLKAAVA